MFMRRYSPREGEAPRAGQGQGRGFGRFTQAVALVIVDVMILKQQHGQGGGLGLFPKTVDRTDLRRDLRLWGGIR